MIASAIAAVVATVPAAMIAAPLGVGLPERPVGPAAMGAGEQQFRPGSHGTIILSGVMQRGDWAWPECGSK